MNKKEHTRIMRIRAARKHRLTDAERYRITLGDLSDATHKECELALRVEYGLIYNARAAFRAVWIDNQMELPF